MILDPAADATTADALAETLAGIYRGPATVSERFEPTLDAARDALAAYDPHGYAKSRNRVDGNVSELNPYITWGVFTLPEVQRVIKGRLDEGSRDYQKFISELGWKAFFREAFLQLGDRVYRSLEPYKYPADHDDRWPDELENGETGLACIDTMVRTLEETGHLHNHKRMWFAAYTVHFAGVEWWHGERFFYRHLLDGEPGPNALSWQWVASTFSHKPYYFNARNMAKNGHEPCDGAPFDASYEELSERFFGGYGRGGYADRPDDQPSTDGSWYFPDLVRDPADAPVVLVHAERLSPAARALQTAGDERPVVIALDGSRLRGEEPSFKRLFFAVSLAADLTRRLQREGRDATLLLFDDEDELAAALGERGESVAAPDSWHPGTWQTLQRLERGGLPTAVVPDEPFAKVAAPLRSFSAWWREAQGTAMRR